MIAKDLKDIWEMSVEAIQRDEPLIYSGRMQPDGLFGDPDLLREEGTAGERDSFMAALTAARWQHVRHGRSKP